MQFLAKEKRAKKAETTTEVNKKSHRKRKAQTRGGGRDRILHTEHHASRQDPGVARAAAAGLVAF